MKLSARQVRAGPPPAAGSAWDAGAAAAELATAAPPEGRRPHLLALGRAMAAAYRVPDPAPLLGWWEARLP